MSDKTIKTVRIIISNIILIIFLVIAYNVYAMYNFNDFVRAESNNKSSSFVRDNKTKHGKHRSYKIESKNFNDAMMYKTIKVEPMTNYRITCMVKTEDVIIKENLSFAGAQISITNSFESSDSVIGTSDWQEIELLFNSKDRTEIELGFRLGGYDGDVKGIAWFSDFKMYEGNDSMNNTWNIATFVFEEIDAVVEGNKNFKISMGYDDFSNIENNLLRFINSTNELSMNKMNAKADLIRIKEPLKTLSYDEKNGYYVSGNDIDKIIKPYMDRKEYDHIFIVVKFGDEYMNLEFTEFNWLGLGGMEYRGIGFSNIRLPSSSKNYANKYNSLVNTFPEEVYIHEFLHDLERINKEYGFDTPVLHDNEKYGYKSKSLIGLKEWYRDYMNKEIKYQNKLIGIDSSIYKLKPTSKNDFLYEYEINFHKEPENIIEGIKNLFSNINIGVKRLQETKETKDFESFRF